MLHPDSQFLLLTSCYHPFPISQYQLLLKLSKILKVSNFWLSLNRTVSEEQMSATAGTQAAGPPPGQDPATNQRTVAQILDEAAAEQKKKDDDKELYDPSRKLVFKPNITPDQREWIDRRAYFVQQLKKEAVLTVMDKNFEEAQKLYLNPPLTNGEILRIQNEHAVDYKAVLGRGGKFHRVPDNLATKMAMLHFGLHVAPLTLNNVLNCSNDGDASDPEDDPEDLPRIQRILYAEKPLEFLDEYSQRSHGYPILRSKCFL